MTTLAWPHCGLQNNVSISGPAPPPVDQFLRGLASSTFSWALTRTSLDTREPAKPGETQAHKEKQA